MMHYQSLDVSRGSLLDPIRASRVGCRRQARGLIMHYPGAHTMPGRPSPRAGAGAMREVPAILPAREARALADAPGEDQNSRRSTFMRNVECL